MPVKDVSQLPLSGYYNKDIKRHYWFDKLIKELQKRELSEVIIDLINANVELVNHAIEKQFALKKQIRLSQKIILKTLENEYKLVPKNHYRNYWMTLGMAVFGVPMGIIWGNVTDNMGSLGIGIGIGMVIGLVYGDSLDKKALREGRQLDIEVQF